MHVLLTIVGTLTLAISVAYALMRVLEELMSVTSVAPVISAADLPGVNEESRSEEGATNAD